MRMSNKNLTEYQEMIKKWKRGIIQKDSAQELYNAHEGRQSQVQQTLEKVPVSKYLMLFSDTVTAFEEEMVSIEIMTVVS